MCDIGWKMIQKGMARAINDVEHFSQPQNGSDEQERAHPLSSDNPALVEAVKSTLDKTTASVFNGRKPSKTSDIKHLKDVKVSLNFTSLEPVVDLLKLSSTLQLPVQRGNIGPRLPNSNAEPHYILIQIQE